MPLPRPNLFVFGSVLIAIAALAACSGGSSSPPPFTSPTAAPTAPASVPSLAPATAATAVPLSVSSSSPQTVAIPPAAGLSGSIVLPAANLPAGTTLNVQTTTVPPAGVPALSIGRHTLSTSTGIQALYFQGLEFSATSTFPAYPAFSITLPSGYNPALGSFNLAFFNGTSWTEPIGTPATVSGGQLQFAGAAGPVTYQANQFYYFALYYTQTPPSPSPVPTATPTSSPPASPSATPISSPTAAPTGSPTAVPTASPSSVPTATPTASPTPSPVPTAGPLTATPNVLSFLGIDPSLAQNVMVSSAFFTGTFTASACVPSGTNPPAVVASVSSVDANGNFMVTPQAAGACTIDVSDGTRHVSVSVTVATSSLTVQSLRKH
jgi:hypothetical protein